jgi:hypothetical protein
MRKKIFLSFNFVVIFNFNVFPFPPSKAKFLSKFHTNRQNAVPVLNYF